MFFPDCHMMFDFFPQRTMAELFFFGMPPWQSIAGVYSEEDDHNLYSISHVYIYIHVWSLVLNQ